MIWIGHYTLGRYCSCQVQTFIFWSFCFRGVNTIDLVTYNPLNQFCGTFPEISILFTIRLIWSKKPTISNIRGLDIRGLALLGVKPKLTKVLTLQSTQCFVQHTSILIQESHEWWRHIVTDSHHVHCTIIVET